MQLTVLGSSGTYPSRGKPASGYLVTSQAGERLLLDAGAGTYMALCERMDPGDLDVVIVSHIHPDHCSDLFALLHRVLYGPAAGPIPLYLPDGAADRLAGFAGESLRDAFDITVVGDKAEAEVGSLALSFGAAAHSVPALLTRVDADARSLVYTGDTGPTERVPTLAAGVDLLIAEASLADGDSWDHHMTPDQAGEAARRAGATELLLTHLRPTVDVDAAVHKAEAAFGGPVTAAIPGLVLDV